jgi:hypothetical protein
MRGRTLPTGCSARAILLAAACAASVPSAMAAVDMSANVTVGGQYDTNARQLASIESPPPSEGSIARDDASTYVTASVNATVGGEGPLRAGLGVSYTHSESMRLETLDHDDYSVSAGVDWRPSQVFDMSLLATQDRLPLGLADVGGNESAPQTTQRYQGVLRLRPTPRWQLSLTPGWNETRTRLPEADDFLLRETGAIASVEFLGAGRLVPGISAARLEGKYSGVVNPTRYTQQVVHGTLGYRLTEVTAFSLEAGQTWRDTHLREPSTDPGALANEGSNSAFTGSLSAFRQLTAKTSVNLNVFRNFQLYEGGVNLSIGTGFRAGVNWAATAKVGVTLDATHTWSTIDNVEFGGVPIKRKDLVRTYSFGVNYRATRAVSFSTSLTRNVRRSEVWSDQYNSTIANVALSVRFD